MEVAKPHASIWREDHLRLAIKAACVALWFWNLDDDRFQMDECSFQPRGLPWADAVSFEQISAHIHRADRDRVRAAFTAPRSVAGEMSHRVKNLLSIATALTKLTARSAVSLSGMALKLDLPWSRSRRRALTARGAGQGRTARGPSCGFASPL